MGACSHCACAGEGGGRFPPAPEGLTSRCMAGGGFYGAQRAGPYVLPSVKEGFSSWGGTACQAGLWWPWLCLQKALQELNRASALC